MVGHFRGYSEEEISWAGCFLDDDTRIAVTILGFVLFVILWDRT